jgi:formamidopyrimidine-DNA glycosylase
MRVSGTRSVRRQPAEEIVARLTGARLGPARRMGKYLLIPLDDAGMLVVHLRMSGQLRLAADATVPGMPHTHVVFDLDDDRQLRFVDPRTFGELFVVEEAAAFPGGLGRLGPDALDPAWSPTDLAATLGRRRALLKSVLMDQRRLAGIGNIYSDEALFGAGLRFDRPAGELTPAEVDALHRSITSVLAEAVAHRGSSLADAQYVDLYGQPGGYQALHRVYGREGQDCPRCGAAILRRRTAGRSTFFCGRCQS